MTKASRKRFPLQRFLQGLQKLPLGDDYEEIQPGLGVRFCEEVEAVTQAIVVQPLLWRERIGGFRRVNLPGFPFHLSYFLRGHKILIAAIAHSSRRPDYWKNRI